MLTRPQLRRLIVAATSDIPLDLLLGGLRLLARVFAAGDAGRGAWWGAKAAEVLVARLAHRPDDVLRRIDWPDLAPIAEARRAGRGVVLAGVHVGPENLAAALVADRFPDALFLMRDRWHGPGQLRFVGGRTAADRRAALVAARAHLRAGGLVYASPDGDPRGASVWVPVGDKKVALGRGVAALARLTGAPALPFAALYSGRRIEVVLGAPLAPGAAAPEAWELEWLTAYATQAAAWHRGAENQRLHGSLYGRSIA